MTRRLIYGVGIDDTTYAKQKRTYSYVNGKKVSSLVWACPYHTAWTGMLKRCYSIKYKSNNPTYLDCTVCEEWLTFSNFKAWMETQNWKGKQLDKDILTLDNKVYNRDTCVFLDKKTNCFMVSCKNKRGEYPIGVYFYKKLGMYSSRCSNPFTNKICCLGYFNDPIEGHKAWQAKKHEYACQLAELQEDPRVADALRQRYAPDKDWTNR